MFVNSTENRESHTTFLTYNKILSNLSKRNTRYFKKTGQSNFQMNVSKSKIRKFSAIFLVRTFLKEFATRIWFQTWQVKRDIFEQ